jgi:hypothetical protein
MGRVVAADHLLGENAATMTWTWLGSDGDAAAR